MTGEAAYTLACIIVAAAAALFHGLFALIELSFHYKRLARHHMLLLLYAGVIVALTYFFALVVDGRL